MSATVQQPQQPHHVPTAMELELAKLRAENEALRQRQRPSGSIKISAKGAVSVYGMGRFPVTLYASQWEALAKKMPEIEAFIVNNVAQLAKKAE